MEEVVGGDSQLTPWSPLALPTPRSHEAQQARWGLGGMG